MVSIPFDSLCWSAGTQVAAERCARNKTLQNVSLSGLEKCGASHPWTRAGGLVSEKAGEDPAICTGRDRRHGQSNLSAGPFW